MWSWWLWGAEREGAVGWEVSQSSLLHHGLPIQVAVRSASLAIVDGLNEFHCRGELHPPIALLPTQPAGVEIIDVLNSGQQARRVCLEGGGSH